MNQDAKPIWYDIYEAFPPKYEPRYDRHLINFGVGSNVAQMPSPPKILYEEDQIRAKYYTAFMPSKEQHSGQPTLASSEVFNMIATEDLARKTLSQIFIEKNNKLRAENKTDESENNFLATIQALEFDGINLRHPPVNPFTESEESFEKNMKTSRPP